MGMFDHIRCKYPLPVRGANDLSYQTKDTPAQALDHYVIRADGTLWHQAYDVEDRSDPTAVGMRRLIGSAIRVRKRWRRERLSGEIIFYADLPPKGWLEFRARFADGELECLNRIKHGTKKGAPLIGTTRRVFERADRSQPRMVGTASSRRPKGMSYFDAVLKDLEPGRGTLKLREDVIPNDVVFSTTSKASRRRSRK